MVTMSHSDERALPAPEDHVTELPAREPIVANLNMLLAALRCASDEETRPYLQGVFIHALNGKVRIAATDGTKLFVSASEVHSGTLPEWASTGAILSKTDLKEKLTLARKLGASQVSIAWAPGHSKAIIRASTVGLELEADVLAETYPAYQKVINDVKLRGSVIDTEAPEKETGIEVTGYMAPNLGTLSDIAKEVYRGADKGAWTMAQISTCRGPQLFHLVGAGECFVLLMPTNAEGDTEMLRMSPITQGMIAGSSEALSTAVRSFKTQARKGGEKKSIFQALAAQLEARRKAITGDVALPAPTEKADEPEAEAPKAAKPKHERRPNGTIKPIPKKRRERVAEEAVAH
jgi:hypothetical protein